ncbi:MAG: hypothetical protein IJ507_07545 [Clostridia bacterium]|nr:hypothetical protein [Clostridia bacterium]
MRDMVVLISLDSSVCQSMARTLRAEHIYCRILPADASARDVLQQDAQGILLAGGSTGEKADVLHLDELLGCGLPVLGMGDAALTLCEAMGGTLDEKATEPGVVQVRMDGSDPLLLQVESGERYLPAMRCMLLREDSARALAHTDSGVLGFRSANTAVYGMAFLPEQNDQDGVQLLINFCHQICGCSLWWSNQTFLDRAQQEILEAAGDAEALCALSGGVDSGVCAILGHMALGQRLHCLFVDTGLLRKDEGDRVMAFYRDQMGLNLQRINAEPEFLAALKDVVSCEEKELIIHRMLQEIMAREVKARPGVRLILQGTNYSDTLDRPIQDEAPEGMQIMEPVRDLFKDEIRRVGEDLNLPPAIINRQPFPGAGLASRISGEVTEEKLTVLREADAIFRRELESDRQSRKLHQYYAMLSDAPFVSGYAIALCAVQLVEGSSRMPARPPYDLLERVARIIRESLPQVSTVVYDLTP